eukprot:5057965-Alexandrium_andersonii.AAC.1
MQLLSLLMRVWIIHLRKNHPSSEGRVLADDLLLSTKSESEVDSDAFADEHMRALDATSRFLTTMGAKVSVGKCATQAIHAEDRAMLR